MWLISVIYFLIYLSLPIYFFCILGIPLGLMKHGYWFIRTSLIAKGENIIKVRPSLWWLHWPSLPSRVCSRTKMLVLKFATLNISISLQICPGTMVILLRSYFHLGRVAGLHTRYTKMNGSIFECEHRQLFHEYKSYRAQELFIDINSTVIGQRMKISIIYMYCNRYNHYKVNVNNTHWWAINSSETSIPLRPAFVCHPTSLIGSSEWAPAIAWQTIRPNNQPTHMHPQLLL